MLIWHLRQPLEYQDGLATLGNIMPLTSIDLHWPSSNLPQLLSIVTSSCLQVTMRCQRWYYFSSIHHSRRNKTEHQRNILLSPIEFIPIVCCGAFRWSMRDVSRISSPKAEEKTSSASLEILLAFSFPWWISTKEHPKPLERSSSAILTLTLVLNSQRQSAD